MTQENKIEMLTEITDSKYKTQVTKVANLCIIATDRRGDSIESQLDFQAQSVKLFCRGVHYSQIFNHCKNVEPNADDERKHALGNTASRLQGAIRNDLQTVKLIESELQELYSNPKLTIESVGINKVKKPNATQSAQAELLVKASQQLLEFGKVDITLKVKGWKSENNISTIGQAYLAAWNMPLDQFPNTAIKDCPNTGTFESIVADKNVSYELVEAIVKTMNPRCASSKMYDKKGSDYDSTQAIRKRKQETIRTVKAEKLQAEKIKKAAEVADTLQGKAMLAPRKFAIKNYLGNRKQYKSARFPVVKKALLKSERFVADSTARKHTDAWREVATSIKACTK